MPPVEQHVELEEKHRHHQSDDNAQRDELHRQIALCARLIDSTRPLAGQFGTGQLDGPADNSRRAQDPDDTRHGDTSDAERTRIDGENILRAHQADSQRYTVADGLSHTGGEVADKGHDNEPDEK